MRFDVLQRTRWTALVGGALLMCPLCVAAESIGDEPPEIMVEDVDDVSEEEAEESAEGDEAADEGVDETSEDVVDDSVEDSMEESMEDEVIEDSRVDVANYEEPRKDSEADRSREPNRVRRPLSASTPRDAATDDVVDLDKLSPLRPIPRKTWPAKSKSATEPEEDTTPAIDATRLKDVIPGRTTREELQKEWGKANRVEKIVGGVRATYRVKTLEQVRVTIIENVVESMSIQLTNPLGPDAVIQRLHVEDIEPVEVFDDNGQLLGLVFPERGILFGFTPNSNPPQVFEVVAEPIDAQPFLARAEMRLLTRYGDCFADLKQVITMAPNTDRAHWLHAELALTAGEPATALKSAHRAIEIDPKEPEYRLTLAKIYFSTGGYSQAITQLRGVVEAKKVPPLVTARAYCQWGDCVGASQDRDYQQALQLHMQAIKLAQPLIGAPAMSTRRAAKELLLDANLAVAHDIGWGRWNQKSKVVPKWLEKAAALADDIVANDQGSPELQLRVYEQGVTALAGISEPPDPSKWIQGLTTLGAKALEEASDPVYKSRVAWQLGIALSDGVEIENALHQSDKALELGLLAMNCFDEGAVAAKQFPTYDYLRGRLCYRLGAIYAIGHSDHKEAVGWFEQAVPLLESPVPPCGMFDPARQGETLVSMAVSFWELNNRREALRLTREGVKLMEQAAEDGLISKSALAIPYGNLANMHQQLGESQEARRFADMAARLERPNKQ